MATKQLPLKVANILFCSSFLLLLAAFVAPNWVRSRHDDDTWGLWQECEFSICQRVKPERGWYIAFVVFETLAFVCCALTVMIILTYVFARTIPDYVKRWVLLASVVSAIATVLFIIIGVIILGASYHTLGGKKDVFGNIIRYELDWCFVVTCFSCGGLVAGLLALARYIHVS